MTFLKNTKREREKKTAVNPCLNDYYTDISFDVHLAQYLAERYGTRRQAGLSSVRPSSCHP